MSNIIPTHPQMKDLLAQTIKAASKFTDVNFMSYFTRRANEKFNVVAEAEPAKQQIWFEKAQEELKVLERQGTIAELFAFKHDHSILENLYAEHQKRMEEQE
eukprot:TRINITY_DN774207_c0_g1_i1.p1 TRINITY_DN774207_c0_g1~~TRINITY_DN774207_c0_g1_i1.p1  ORF type:complete len:102 (-),score=23.16 TRINITY_DN774207_c0_g1_i1:241-546(-)